MTRNERLGALALVAACILVGWLLWSNDPAHRAEAAQRGLVLKAQGVSVATFTPAPTRQVGPHMAFNHVLIAELGDYARTTENPGRAACHAKKSAPLSIRGAARTLDGVLYLQVRLSADCAGWVESVYISGYESWRNSLAPGERVYH